MNWSLQSWSGAFTGSLLSVWSGVLDFIPKLIFALVIFAIGWLLAVLLEKLVEHIFKALKIDAGLKSAGLEDVVKRGGHNLNSGLFVGALVKWFVILVFLMASFDMLQLNAVTQFLYTIVNYLPSVIVAVLILFAAGLIGTTMQKVVVASGRASHLHVAELAGRITKWAIWIFAILTALVTLGIAPALIYIFVQMAFGGIALAIGLAFGLGGKEVASKILDRVSKAVLEKE